MAGKALDERGMLVGGVAVDDGVDQLAGWYRGLDGVEEADELPVPGAPDAAADDAAVEHVARGEQGGGGVALMVVRHGAAAAASERQAGLGTGERPDPVGPRDDPTTRRRDAGRAGLVAQPDVLKPARVNRSCRRQTAVLATPASRMTATVP